VQDRKTTRRTASSTNARKRRSTVGVSRISVTEVIPGQSTSLLLGYVREEARDSAVRQVSATEQHPAVSAWLFAIDLFTAVFAYDSDNGAPPLASTAELSFAVRHQLLAGATRAAKPTLDLILAGYYREAWALELKMLDEWAECVYLRVQPPGTPVPPCEPTWREVTRAVASRGDAADRALLAEATPRWDFLTVAVRPLSGHTAATFEIDPDSVAFKAAYDAELCELALSCGLFINRALLKEIALLSEQPPQWLHWQSIFSDVVTPVYSAGRPEMERWTKERIERCSGSRSRR
jgi:hypothetical protein